eukprot:scaffold160_cov157-Skeletonema_menzelii.AAC.12
MAEARDELLFKQPESSYLGDCPICVLPMPICKSKCSMQHCCSKLICNGCYYANKIRDICPFCRFSNTRSTNEDLKKRKMERILANDPVAILNQGKEHEMKGDFIKAVKNYKKAIELGDLGGPGLGSVDAHFQLSIMYREGRGVEKDEGKEIFHVEESAIGGHPIGRFNLGRHEYINGDPKRAVKHWIIAVAQGDKYSLKVLMEKFKKKNGLVDKKDLAAALRAHQTALDATKSPQREVADNICLSLGKKCHCC